MIILNAWTTSGTFMLFYLASLQSISGDGLRGCRDRWRERLADVQQDHLPASATRPLLRRHRGGHRGAPAVRPGGHRRRTDGDPNNALMTIVLYLYNAAFSQFNFGYAAAVGIILFVFIFGVTLIQRRLFGEAPSW